MVAVVAVVAVATLVAAYLSHILFLAAFCVFGNWPCLFRSAQPHVSGTTALSNASSRRTRRHPRQTAPGQDKSAAGAEIKGMDHTLGFADKRLSCKFFELVHFDIC